MSRSSRLGIMTITTLAAVTLACSKPKVEIVKEETKPKPMHCQLIRAGEIEAIVGDGAGHRVRPGIWALSSIHHQFSIFKNMSSGLLFGEFRGKANTVLEYVDDSTSVLTRESTEDYPTKARLEFRMKSPYYLDTELTMRDTQDRLAGKPYRFRSVSVNCYANSPEDIRIHYLSEGEWVRFIPSVHAGPGTPIHPSYLPKEELEVRPKDYNDPPFNWGEWNKKSFDEPFYYGRFQKMVMILIFDRPKWIRFYTSPIGGGESLIPGIKSPAWDFEWIIPEKDYQINRDYTVRVRLVYKQYESDEDVLKEFRKAQDELGFEKVR
jgi:hypothetical protein